MEIGGQMNLAEIVQAAISAIGFIFVIYQIIHLIRSIRGVTQDSLYTHYTEVCKIFLEKSYLRPYFYENKVFTSPNAENPNLQAEIEFMSEAILGLIEHAILQRNNLPDDAWTNCWQPYARERIRKSVEIKKFFAPNQNWYTGVLRDVVNSLIKETES